jgi:hypothetical protein
MDRKELGAYKGTTLYEGDDIAKIMADIDRGSAIKAEDIKPTPAVTAPTPTGSSSGQTIDQITAEVQAQKLKAEKALDTSKSTLESRIQEITGVMGSREALEKEQGLDQAQLDVSDIRSQIEAREHALRRSIEELGKRGGLSGRQMQVKINALNRDAARELADLSIIESARLRRFDSISTNIDRKIKSQLEPLQFQLQFDQMFYQENRQAMTAAQDRAFQMKIMQEERSYQEQVKERDSIKQIAMTAAQYGATGEQIKSITDAKNFDEAIKSGGSFLGEPFRLTLEAHKSQLLTDQLQRSNIVSQMAERQAQIQALKAQAQMAQQMEMIQKIESFEVKSSVVDNSLTVVDRLLKNESGLKASTGTLPLGLGQLPFGFAPRTKEVTLKDGSKISIPSMKLNESRFAEKADFLADASFIVNNLTFDKLKELKAGGATFGALSDKELQAIGSASDVLASMSQKNKEGQITGFKGSEAKVAEQIKFIQSKLQKEKDSLGSEILSPAERLQIYNFPN